MFGQKALPLAKAVAVISLIMGLSNRADAALSQVGPISFENGFPLWYADGPAPADLHLALCTDPLAPCAFAPPNPRAPITIPDNFGPEAFYWFADSLLAFPGGNGRLVLALEASFANGDPKVGDQVVFSRSRVRVTVDLPGNYVITHPFGSFSQVVTAADIAAGRARNINQTLDVGIGVPGAFTAALGGAIGPFLLAAGTPPFVIRDPRGNLYIGDTITDVPITGSPTGANIFRVTRNGTVLGETNLFTIMGKVFDAVTPNAAPMAIDDPAPGAPPFATGVDQALPNIDILANDIDLVDPVANAYGINPGAVGLGNIVVATAAPVANPGFVIDTGVPFTTVNGGTAVKNIDGTVTYTPAPGFAGTDTFQYVVQDRGGLLSNLGTVSVVVEDLRVNRALLRLKLLKWSISGTSTATLNNTITIRKGADGRGPIIGTALVAPDGSWSFQGKSIASPGGAPVVSVTSVNGVQVLGAPLTIR